MFLSTKNSAENLPENTIFWCDGDTGVQSVDMLLHINFMQQIFSAFISHSPPLPLYKPYERTEVYMILIWIKRVCHQLLSYISNNKLPATKITNYTDKYHNTIKNYLHITMFFHSGQNLFIPPRQYRSPQALTKPTPYIISSMISQNRPFKR